MMFLRCVAEAVMARGLRGLLGLAPLSDQLYEVAADVIERYRVAKRLAAIGADAEEVVRGAPEAVRDAVLPIAAGAAVGQDERTVTHLVSYLSQLPGVARSSFRCPSDPDGRSVPGGLDLSDATVLMALLPRRVPLFKAGDPVPNAPSWVFADLLGAGGFGEVWLARHSFLDERRAFKFCLNPQVRERMLRHEGEIVKRVMRASGEVRGGEHGIVPLRDAFLEGETPWLAYEYVPGGDLAAWMRQAQPRDPAARAASGLSVLRDLCRVVGRLHRQSSPVVHRDIKPANVLVQPHGSTFVLRVTDFGIGHASAAQAMRDATLTTPSVYLGETFRGACTPLYASLQQKMGLRPEPRDDVHALAVLGYQLLLGDPALGRPAGKWRKRLADAAIPDGVLDVLESAWDDEPAERPLDAMALVEQLEDRCGAVAPEPPAAREFHITGIELEGIRRVMSALGVPVLPDAPDATPLETLIPGHVSRRQQGGSMADWQPDGETPGPVSQQPGQEYKFRPLATATEADLARLPDLARWWHLAALDLSECDLPSDAALEHAAGLAQLSVVNLSGRVWLTDAGLSRIAGLRRLVSLDLGGCPQVTDQGIQAVSTLAYLEELDIRACPLITDLGLLRLGGLRKLRLLVISDCPKLTRLGVSAFGRLLPKCEVRR